MFDRFKRNTIDVGEALAGQRAGRLELVDVREDAERAQGFAPGSRHLPLSRLRDGLGELPVDRPVAFICRSGHRSAMAASAARRAGLDARNVAGGMAEWERRDLETTRRTR